MESGDHVDSHKIMSLDDSSKHAKEADSVAVKNLHKSERISSHGESHAGDSLENFLMQSDVSASKFVPSKTDIHEFILHEGGGGVPLTEFSNAQDQGQKTGECSNTDFVESSPKHDSKLNGSLPSVNSVNEQDSLNKVTKGLGGEQTDVKDNIEINSDVIANSAVSKGGVCGESLNLKDSVNNLESEESHSIHEVSVGSVGQTTKETGELGLEKGSENSSSEIHPKVNEFDHILKDSSNKEGVSGASKTQVVVSSDFIHGEKWDALKDNKKSDLPEEEKHVEFITHESDVKNSSEYNGVTDSDSKGSQLIHPKKIVSESEKDDSDSSKTGDILQENSDPKLPEAMLKTSDEKETSEEDKEEEWLDIVGSGQLMKKILRKGENDFRPQNSFICEINLEGRLEDGTVVEKYENTKIQVGDFEVVQGLDLALPLMNVGELALIEVGPRFAYGSLGNLPEIPPNAKLIYQIELLSAENEPEMESLSIAERRQIGDKKRERGNWWYSRKEYSFAIRSYRRALEFLDDAEEGFSVEKKEISEDTERQFQELLEDRLKVYNNLAAAHIMNKSYDAALTSVENVLRCQPQNVKALRRKAKILAAKGEAAAALSILRTASQLDPDSTPIRQEIQRLQDVIKRDTKQEKSLYKKMLGQNKPVEKSAPKAPKISYRTWGIVCSSVAVVLLGAVAYRYKFL